MVVVGTACSAIVDIVGNYNCFDLYPKPSLQEEIDTK